MSNFLARERSVAAPGFNRWLVPPAALAIHLCIGQVYGFSVFKLPMTKLLGITKPGPGDWSQSQLAVIFSIAIFFLGLSAAVFGKWVEEQGPRKSMFVAASCFGGGFIAAAIGVALHNLWIVYLGYGVLGGVGLGIGYISPVSTLVKWFPDRPGMATGMAIMGFGGGAMIGSPLAVDLMKVYATPTSVGVVPTLVTMGVIYFLFMMFGVFTVRVPAPDWKPAGFVASSSQPQKLVTNAHVTADNAWKTPSFWLLWVILCFNVTAGIGILEQASPMIQEMLLVPNATRGIDPADTAAIAHATAPLAAIAGGFVGLLGLFNMLGRFFWSSMSDYTGRKNIYFIYLLLGPVLYFLIPVAGRMGSTPLFVGICVVILSMYGGGFAAIPAYLRDLFGTLQVGAIHGRLITAWSVAGVLGPLLVNGIRDYQIAHGAVGVERYAPSMYLMCGLLLVAAFCNFLVGPVDPKYHVKDTGYAPSAEAQSMETKS